MVAHSQLGALLRAHRATDVVDAPDREHSVSGRVVRAVLDGRRTAAVGSDASTELVVGALLDLLDLHLHAAPVGTHPDEVRLVVGRSAPAEAFAALGTLVSDLRGGPRVSVLAASEDGVLVPVTAVPADVSAAGARYAALLSDVAPEPPRLLRSVVRMTGRDDLRAYPRLGSSSWSLRLEGLEVGRFAPGRAALDVGRDTASGRRSGARRAWVTAVGTDRPIELTEDHAGVGAAVTAISAFAAAWLGSSRAALQDEHALESRVLRGACPVVSPSGPLEVLRPDPVVSWGSQLPTRWAADGRPRYLDAVMRRGGEPWAVELKVHGSNGVGAYYRHAVARAALHRHFVRSAPALDPWFAGHGLDRNACRAAVLVPDLAAAPRWRERLRTVASLFDVEVAEVAEQHARLRPSVPAQRSRGSVPQPV